MTGSTSSAATVESFERDGYVGPTELLPVDVAARAYQDFFRTIGQDIAHPGPSDVELGGWHAEHRWAYELATRPELIDPVVRILGDDLVLWAMRFWYKAPGDPAFIPWHQDIAFWPLDPPVNVTCWVALGESTRANGCLRVIPGTHTQAYEHGPADSDDARLSRRLADDVVDVGRALDLEMSPGQGIVFSERLFHASEPNSSPIARVAFSLRFTTPDVRFEGELWDGLPIKTFVVTGVDRFGLNERLRGTPPQAE